MLKRKCGARERVQWVKEFAAKPEKLSSIPRPHRVRKDPTVASPPACTPISGAHAHTQTHRHTHTALHHILQRKFWNLLD